VRIVENENCFELHIFSSITDNNVSVNGKCYKDVVSSWWCNLLGHCNPVISTRLKEQADNDRMIKVREKNY